MRMGDIMGLFFLLKRMTRKRYRVVLVPFCVSLLFLLSHALALPAPSIPRRIISLVPNITEELFDLGVQDRIVGVTTYCQRPLEAQSKERVGAVVEVNVEKVISLRPIWSSPLPSPTISSYKNCRRWASG